MRSRYSTWNLIMALGVLYCGAVSSAAGRGELSIQAGLAVSNNPAFDTVALVEFPFTLNRSEFQFYRPDSTSPDWYARIFAQVNLINLDGFDIDSTNTYFSVRVANPDDTVNGDIKLMNELSLPVKPGVYTARLTVIDAVSKRSNSVFYDRVVVEPAPAALALGGGRLAYRIRPADTTLPGVNRRMLKNGLEVLTNPVGLVDARDTALFVYAELYNLTMADAPQDRYRVQFRVLDSSGVAVRELGTISRSKPGPTAVVAQSFDITGWRTGFYSLELAATDPASQRADTLTLPFRIMSTSEVATIIASRASSPDPYDSLSLSQKLNLVKYELTPDQRLTLESLSDSGKENYLRQYWRDRDETPATTANEARLELIRRFHYANDRFSTNEMRDNGWLSDRGRIYIRYGEPSETVSRFAPVVGYPYLVWFYRNIREGLAFVFEDQHGYSDFELVHSNADGEIFNQIWDSRLKEGAFIEINHDI
ncbi:MAG: GWxTD domain-containing protein [candidate division Zixibacteria bacterium]|nr:GWxTD domain-containing protein [candidate division Zixibacteria bacterium]